MKLNQVKELKSELIKSQNEFEELRSKVNAYTMMLNADSKTLKDKNFMARYLELINETENKEGEITHLKQDIQSHSRIK